MKTKLLILLSLLLSLFSLHSFGQFTITEEKDSILDLPNPLIIGEFYKVGNRLPSEKRDLKIFTDLDSDSSFVYVRYKGKSILKKMFTGHVLSSCIKGDTLSILNLNGKINSFTIDWANENYKLVNHLNGFRVDEIFRNEEGFILIKNYPSSSRNKLNHLLITGINYKGDTLSHFDTLFNNRLFQYSFTSNQFEGYNGDNLIIADVISGNLLFFNNDLTIVKTINLSESILNISTKRFKEILPLEQGVNLPLFKIKLMEISKDPIVYSNLLTKLIFINQHQFILSIRNDTDVRFGLFDVRLDSCINLSPPTQLSGPFIYTAKTIAADNKIPFMDLSIDGEDLVYLERMYDYKVMVNQDDLFFVDESSCMGCITSNYNGIMVVQFKNEVSKRILKKRLGEKYPHAFIQFKNPKDYASLKRDYLEK